MKMSSAMRPSKAGIADFFLNHGEKIGFAVIALLGGWLLWGGLSSIITKRPTAEMAPTVINQQASSAEAHVRESKQLPEEKRSPGDVAKLAEQLGTWISPTVNSPAEFVAFDKPLFNAFEKRTKPDVFPIEDLHVEAGVAVLPKQAGFGMGGFGGPPGFGGMGGMGPRGMGPGGMGPRGMGPGGMRPGGGETEDDRRQRGGRNDRGRGGAPEEGAEGLAGGGFPGRGGPMMGPGFGGPGFGRDDTPGKVMPFVMVTGLIPYGKQMTEYEVRYGQSSYRDPERDSPKWSQFRVERAEVDGSGELDWKPIDAQKVAEQASQEWVGLQPDVLPEDCLLFDVPELARSQLPVSPYAYNMPLPQRLDGSWGVEAIHPWFVSLLEKRRDDQRAMQAAAGQAAGGGRMGMMGSGMMGPGMMGSGMGSGMGSSMGSGMMGPGMRGPGSMMGSGMGSSMGSGMMSPGMRGPGSSMMGSGMGSSMMGSGSSMPGGGMRGMGSGMRSGMGSGSGMMGPGGGGSPFMDEGEGETGGGEMMAGDQMFAAPAPVEYRLFRFIDTTVEPGKTYRYRVRISLWNPNVKLHPRYLASEDVASPQKLASEASEESASISVPYQTQLLARTLDRTEARKVKGVVEALVLGPNPKSGNYTMRSVSLDRGDMANALASEGNARDRDAADESINSDTMLVDVIGQQEKPDDKRRGKDSEVPEPLDLLFMREDGSLEVVAAADSQKTADRYLPTLPGYVDPQASERQDPRNPSGGPFGPGGSGSAGSSPYGGGGGPFGSGGPFGGGSSPFGGGGGPQGRGGRGGPGAGGGDDGLSTGGK